MQVINNKVMTSQGEISYSEFKSKIADAYFHVRKACKDNYDDCSDVELDNIIHNMEEMARVFETH